MKFLLDTNVWMDALLVRPRAAEGHSIFGHCPASDLAITDVSICSVGIYTARQKPQLFRKFLADIDSQRLSVLVIPRAQWPQVVDRMEKFSLDFDDAYQYMAAEIHQLQLISFDAHFDRTPLGRKTPAQVMP